ncbi:unnamed protein product [Notodromas monacha]|uniref:ubiquitinyl hydrolase 1 n=1 Tax=Notodromas monacha TaxID=399045 RepID=A0A7R9BNH8_9CRUS|nr:unnamed protein product [Notodromas monacha]CAG0918732.1 unnamed protein product [Notodromas monacha]
MSDMGPGNWCLIESDPGVFSELIKNYGEEQLWDQLIKVIQNACATQALLSILLNVPNLELGTALTEFKEFSAKLGYQRARQD